METEAAETVVAGLRGRMGDLLGRDFGPRRVVAADDFAYTDPVSGEVTPHQGLRVIFDDGARIVLRLSGTGTEGATLRLYLDRYVAGPEGLEEDPQAALADMIATAEEILQIRAITGRAGPDVVT